MRVVATVSTNAPKWRTSRRAELGCSPRRGLLPLSCNAAARLGHGPSDVGLKSAEDRPLSARPATLGKAGLCIPAFPGLQFWEI